MERQRRSTHREREVALGKKSASKALTEEAIEEAADWLSGGGLKRLWVIARFLFCLLTLLVVVALATLT